MIETKPFRTPLFPGCRVRVQIGGEIVNHTTGKVVAKISMNPGNRRVTSFEGGDPKTREARNEYLSRFYSSDFMPIIAKLRQQRDGVKEAARKAKAESVTRLPDALYVDSVGTVAVMAGSMSTLSDGSQFQRQIITELIMRSIQHESWIRA